MASKWFRRSIVCLLVFSAAAGLCACSGGSQAGDREEIDITETEEYSSETEESSAAEDESSVKESVQVSSGLESLDDMTEEALKEAVDYSYEMLTDFADSWTSNESLEGLTYVGAIYLTARPGAAVSHDNLLDLVFRMDVCADGIEKSFYRVTEVTNLVWGSDGKIEIDYSSYSDKLTSPNGDGMIHVGSASYYGFSSLEEVRETRIDGLTEGWIAESDIDFGDELIEEENRVSADASSSGNSQITGSVDYDRDFFGYTEDMEYVGNDTYDSCGLGVYVLKDNVFYQRKGRDLWPTNYDPGAGIYNDAWEIHFSGEGFYGAECSPVFVSQSEGDKVVTAQIKDGYYAYEITDDRAYLPCTVTPTDEGFYFQEAFIGHAAGGNTKLYNRWYLGDDNRPNYFYDEDTGKYTEFLFVNGRPAAEYADMVSGSNCQVEINRGTYVNLTWMDGTQLVDLEVYPVHYMAADLSQTIDIPTIVTYNGYFELDLSVLEPGKCYYICNSEDSQATAYIALVD